MAVCSAGGRPGAQRGLPRVDARNNARSTAPAFCASAHRFSGLCVELMRACRLCTVNPPGAPLPVNLGLRCHSKHRGEFR